jgi:hypothetical protein
MTTDRDHQPTIVTTVVCGAGPCPTTTTVEVITPEREAHYAARRDAEHAARASSIALTHDIHQALLAAGFVAGSRSDRNRHGTVYADAVDGFIVDRRADQRGDYRAVTWGVTRVVVDHQGKGQVAAIARYLAALARAGFEVEVGPANPVREHKRSPKLVVYVIGRKSTDASATEPKA